MSTLTQALGWTLIHFCWQATVVAALALAIETLLRKASSQTRYLIGLAAMFGMCLLATVTFCYECALASRILPENLLPLSFALSTEHSAMGLRLKALLPWIDSVWWLGLFLSSTRSIGGWWMLQKVRSATLVPPAECVQTLFQETCSKLGIAKLPSLLVSNTITNPLTFGVFRAVVLLPAAAILSLDADQLATVLTHELAHVRRADYFWNLVQTAVESLFFFHPAVWWLGQRLREQRELCCDDMVVSTHPDPLIYATALFRLEECRATKLHLAMALDGHAHQSQFHTRIRRVLGENRFDSSARPFRSLVALGVCVSLMVYFLSVRPMQGSSQALASFPKAAQLTVPKANTPQKVAIRIHRQAHEVAAAHIPAAPEALPAPLIATDGMSDEPPAHLRSPAPISEPPPHVSSESVSGSPPPHIGT